MTLVETSKGCKESKNTTVTRHSSFALGDVGEPRRLTPVLLPIGDASGITPLPAFGASELNTCTGFNHPCMPHIPMLWWHYHGTLPQHTNRSLNFNISPILKISIIVIEIPTNIKSDSFLWLFMSQQLIFSHLKIHSLYSKQGLWTGI